MHVSPTVFNLDGVKGPSAVVMMRGIKGNLIGSAPSNPSTGYSWMVDVDSSGACGPKGSIVLE